MKIVGYVWRVWENGMFIRQKDNNLRWMFRNEGMKRNGKDKYKGKFKLILIV